MQHTKIRTGLLSAVLSLAWLATACGSESVSTPENPDVASTVPGEPDIISKPVTTEVSSRDASEPKVTLGNTEQTTTSQPPGDVGDDPFGPMPGEEVGVIGVCFDDVLNVRASPGVDEGIVTTLDPMARIAATCRHRQLSSDAY